MVDLLSYFSFQPVLQDWCNSVGIFVMKKRIRVFFLLKAKTHLILLDDTINMTKN